MPRWGWRQSRCAPHAPAFTLCASLQSVPLPQEFFKKDLSAEFGMAVTATTVDGELLVSLDVASCPASQPTLVCKVESLQPRSVRDYCATYKNEYNPVVGVDSTHSGTTVTAHFPVAPGIATKVNAVNFLAGTGYDPHGFGKVCAQTIETHIAVLLPTPSIPARANRKSSSSRTMPKSCGASAPESTRFPTRCQFTIRPQAAPDRELDFEHCKLGRQGVEREQEERCGLQEGGAARSQCESGRSQSRR